MTNQGKDMPLRFFQTTLSALMIGYLVTFPIVCSGNDAAEEPTTTQSTTDVLVVVGAEGAPEYGDAFADWAERWAMICERADQKMVQIAEPQKDSDAIDRLRDALQSLADGTGEHPLWIVLIGHGTWDGTTANFNLVGPDVSAQSMNDWLRGIERPIVLVNCSSSSAPFIDRLSGPRRVIVTATKSGSEQNYARFGEFFSRALASAEADVDHDDAVSVREAFLKASSDVERYYKEQGRLTTEHALLDDNGDRKGSDDALVAGTATAKDAAQADGTLAATVTLPVPGNTLRLSEQQLRRRAELESQLSEVRQSHDADPETLRTKALPILLKLAELYAEAEAETPADGQ